MSCQVSGKKFLSLVGGVVGVDEGRVRLPLVVVLVVVLHGPKLDKLVFIAVFGFCQAVFFIVVASGGLYSTIYINNSQYLIIIFVHWTQLSEY